MMKRFFPYTFLAVALALYCSCSKDDNLPLTPIVDLGGETWVDGPIDHWLDSVLLDPYNIEVKYKWDPYELNYQKDLVPVKEEKVIPVMTAVKDIWIKPYEDVAGSTFIKTFAPKQFVLAGSAEYNSDGTITLGEAEGGRKILLMVINDYDRTNLATVQQMMHTILHEFSHILHQNRLYPVEWKALNPEWYTATWYNSTDADAHEQGLVTSYAKAAPDEDFVETIAVLLVNGQAYYDNLVSSVQPSAQEILTTKETMIIDYFQREYSIDFRELQQHVQDAISQYIADGQ